MSDTMMVIYGLKLNLINISLKTIVLEEGVLCPWLKGHKVQRQYSIKCISKLHALTKIQKVINGHHPIKQCLALT